MRRRILLTVAAVALFGGGVAVASVVAKSITLPSGKCVTVAKTKVCAATVHPSTVTVASTTMTTTVFLTLTTPPPPPAVAFTDGTFRVGVDVAPGTYQASAPGDCYWARLSGFSGTLGDIIANANNVAIVTISPGDVGFLSHRCGSWVKIG